MKKILMTFALAALSAGQFAMAQAPAITVHQDPNCGCCGGWAQHMRDSGFDVKVIQSANMYAVKQQHGVPMELASCHTARVEATGQIIEGHVPANAVRKMLLDPSIKGVAAPGMPVNSPGMGPMDGNLITVDFNGKPFSRDRSAAHEKPQPELGFWTKAGARLFGGLAVEVFFGFVGLGGV